jgi:competence/damage-inducible protein CinA-like protein
MRCEIVSIGTELLLGQIVDTNASEIARALRAAGADVLRFGTVGDNAGRIADDLRDALARSDCVIATGGLGPTVDDVTREAAAAATGRELEFREDLWRQVEAMFRRFGRVPTDNNRRQACVPEGSRPIANPVGTAPGFAVESETGLLIVLPGVPSEMRQMLLDDVVPFIRERFGLGDVLLVRELHTVGLGESQIDDRIGDLERLANPTVGLAAHPGRVDVRVVAKADSQAEAERLLEPLVVELVARLDRWIYGVDGNTLAGAALDRLARRGWCLVATEAGMAGALVGELAAAPGPFRRGETRPGPESLTALAGAVERYRLMHDADAAVGASLDAGTGDAAMIGHAVVVTPDGRGERSATFSGHPSQAPERAAALALGLLWRELGLRGPQRMDPA